MSCHALSQVSPFTLTRREFPWRTDPVCTGWTGSYSPVKVCNSDALPYNASQLVWKPLWTHLFSWKRGGKCPKRVFCPPSPPAALEILLGTSQLEFKRVKLMKKSAGNLTGFVSHLISTKMKTVSPKRERRTEFQPFVKERLSWVSQRTSRQTVFQRESREPCGISMPGWLLLEIHGM